MLFRILGEVLIGLLAAGLVVAVAVPASMRLGYDPQPWLAWVAVAVSMVVCIALGERRHKRRNTRQSP
jgi:membrane protein implicated in regulation of membrane protease activity